MKTACKKEEVKKEEVKKEMNADALKGLVLISNHYCINGFEGKLFKDSKGTQILFPEVTPKAVQYTGVYEHIVEHDELGRETGNYYTCKTHPTRNCAWVNRNGNLTLVVKPGTITN